MILDLDGVSGENQLCGESARVKNIERQINNFYKREEKESPVPVC